MGRDRQKKTRKPRFLTQPPTRYIKQVDAIMLDSEFTAEQKAHALNGVWRDAMRQLGYYDDTFRKIDRAVNEALKTCGGV